MTPKLMLNTEEKNGTFHSSLVMIDGEEVLTKNVNLSNLKAPEDICR
jgi:hypothetical protein